MRLIRIETVAVIAALCASVIAGREAATAAPAWCPGPSARGAAQKPPASLAPAISEAFGVSPDAIDAAAYVRCVGRKTMACWVGANLACGKADTRRNLSGASAFCRGNPDAASVPMAATGHATIYDWRCVGRRAVAGKVIAPVDAGGYIAGNWRELPQTPRRGASD